LRFLARLSIRRVARYGATLLFIPWVSGAIALLWLLFGGWMRLPAWVVVLAEAVWMAVLFAAIARLWRCPRCRTPMMPETILQRFRTRVFPWECRRCGLGFQRNTRWGPWPDARPMEEAE
jgi:rubredoxin